jgi:hypothetical protein
LVGPDDSLLWHSEPFVEESRQLLQEHRDRVKDIKARDAMKEEYPAELERYEAADAELCLRQEAEGRAAAPRWRRLEFGTASLVLLFGLALRRWIPGIPGEDEQPRRGASGQTRGRVVKGR